MSFVHLHTHTEYSLLDSINKVESIPEYVKKELSQDALAITDHGTLGGIYKFWKACKKAEVKPIIGMEAYYTVGDRTERIKDDLDKKYYHLLLIALNNTGLHNLIKLSSIAYATGLYSEYRIDDALLEEYNEGLCVTTACIGSRVNALILNNRTKDAISLIDKHEEIFSGRFLIELQLHNLPEQEHVNRVLLKIASQKNIPIILTNDCHFTKKEDKYIHELSLCMQTNTVLNNPKRFSFRDIQVHISSEEEMEIGARRAGIPLEAIQNTRAVSNMVKDETYFCDVKNTYPKFQHLPEDMKSYEYLEVLAKEGLYKRFNNTLPPLEYRERLDEELKILKKMGFSDYMLIVDEFLRQSRENDIPVGPGRGSCGGSLVAYSLGITAMDPIEYKMLFSRFLNDGRGAIPIIFDD